MYSVLGLIRTQDLSQETILTLLPRMSLWSTMAIMSEKNLTHHPTHQQNDGLTVTVTNVHHLLLKKTPGIGNMIVWTLDQQNGLTRKSF